MAFFGITQLGFQNYVREHSVVSKEDAGPRGTKQLGFVALPPLKPNNPPARSIVPTNQTASFGPGHDRSHKEFTRMRTKHIRNPATPQSLYYYPPTTSSEPGWWLKDSPIHVNRPWTQVPRRPLINSEMSSFVDTMALTNRQFTLY